MTQAEIDAFFDRYKLGTIFVDGDGDTYALILDREKPIEYEPSQNPFWVDYIPNDVVLAFISPGGINRAVRRISGGPNPRWEDFPQEEADLLCLIAYPFLKEQD